MTHLTRALVATMFLVAASMLAMACGSSGDPASGPALDPEPTFGFDEPAASDVPGGRGAPGASEDAPGIGSAADRRGGFVPLDNPVMIAAGEATYMQPDDRVLGVTVNGESRAYPINMMTYHHVANDVIGGEPVLITF